METDSFCVLSNSSVGPSAKFLNRLIIDHHLNESVYNMLYDIVVWDPSNRKQAKNECREDIMLPEQLICEDGAH